MSTITDHLDRLEAIEKAATPGPLSLDRVIDNDGVAYSTPYSTWVFLVAQGAGTVAGLWALEGKDESDANALATFRNTNPALVRFVRAVLGLQDNDYEVFYTWVQKALGDLGDDLAAALGEQR